MQKYKNISEIKRLPPNYLIHNLFEILSLWYPQLLLDLQALGDNTSKCVEVVREAVEVDCGA